MSETTPVVLTSDILEVQVQAGKGGDITAIVDRASGINVLYTTPWRPDALPNTSASYHSQHEWLAAYGGGWQTLIPNAGPEREHDGMIQGYHGEASLRAWTVRRQSASHIDLEVQLVTAPLRLRRVVTVNGAALTIDASVSNVSASPVSFRWVEHPAFGAPFIDADAYLETDAELLVTDAAAPGSALPADALLEHPFGRPDIVDVSRFPAPGATRSVFGALTDFTNTRFTIASPNLGFAMTLEWDPTVFPFAWFWQELNESTEHPWFGRAYVAAIEPANTLPGEGAVGRFRRGQASTIEGLSTVTTRITVSRAVLTADTRSRREP